MRNDLRTLKPVAKPAKLRAPATKPTGPRYLRITEQIIGGPGDPPTDFIGGQNSVTEWYVYWALFKILGTSVDDPRKPPYFGLPGKFVYQSSQMGGYVRALGSAVVDFLVTYGATLVALRLQTERFHIFTDAAKQAYDTIQRANLSKTLTVIDIYDEDILGDPSGAKAIVTCKRALGLIEDLNPVTAGTAIRASRLRTAT